MISFMDDVKLNVDALLDGMDLDKLFEAGDDKDKKQIGFWLYHDYHGRYDKLQKLSNNKFGKLCQKVIMRLIDKADRPTAAEAS